MLSFSELNYSKKLLQINTDGKSISIDEINIPEFRPIYSIIGNFETCINKIKQIKSNAYELTPWIEVILENKDGAIHGFSDVQKETENLDVEILKVSFKNKQEKQSREQLLEKTRNIKELKPIEIFQMKCQEQGFELDKNQEILDAFNEVLNIVKEKN